MATSELLDVMLMRIQDKRESIRPQRAAARRKVIEAPARVRDARAKWD